MYVSVKIQFFDIQKSVHNHITMKNLASRNVQIHVVNARAVAFFDSGRKLLPCTVSLSIKMYSMHT